MLLAAINGVHSENAKTIQFERHVHNQDLSLADYRQRIENMLLKQFHITPFPNAPHRSQEQLVPLRSLHMLKGEVIRSCVLVHPFLQVLSEKARREVTSKKLNLNF